MEDKKSKIADLASSVKDEVISSVVECDAFPEVVKDIASEVLSEGAAGVVGSVLGALAPRAHGVILGYKEARFERNVLLMLEEMNKRISKIDEKLISLPDKVRQQFQTEYASWLLDCVYDEKQTTKIPYYIKGFVGMMEEDTTDDAMLMFLDTLSQLTTLDLRVLGMYGFNDENIYSVMEDFSVDNAEITVSKEKLVRFGLLQRKNDIQRDANIDSVVEYLTKVSKESKKSKPKEIKLSGVKKISGTESYKTTGLGYKYLKRLEISSIIEQ